MGYKTRLQTIKSALDKTREKKRRFKCGEEMQMKYDLDVLTNFYNKVADAMEGLKL